MCTTMTSWWCHVKRKVTSHDVSVVLRVVPDYQRAWQAESLDALKDAVTGTATSAAAG